MPRGVAGEPAAPTAEPAAPLGAKRSQEVPRGVKRCQEVPITVRCFRATLLNSDVNFSALTY